MTDPLHHQLLGYLLGALDDDEQQSVDARLERDEEYCRRLTDWRRRLAPLEAMRPDFEPPPGLAERTCRFVAACMPTESPPRPRNRMSPCPAPPYRIARVGWLDVAAVAMLLVTVGAMVLPAIQGSRFQARLTSCQDDLRQLGVALTQYSEQDGGALSRLAREGRLTATGVFVAELLQDVYLTTSGRTVCPDAWLAVQGAMRKSLHLDARNEDLSSSQVVAANATAMPGKIVCVSMKSPSVGPELAYPDQDADDWSGTWRNGMTEGRRMPPSPAELPLLADAPSAELPGQNFPSHGGQGRNVLFEDGHVSFLPVALDDMFDDGGFYGSDGFAVRGISVPIIYTSGHR